MCTDDSSIFIFPGFFFLTFNSIQFEPEIEYTHPEVKAES